ncbi:MAG: hypothetical protein IJS14_05360 [Lentisphaeria bacterium]|nr:hypothetical protein [Lentisphaeria bacterium]
MVYRLGKPSLKCQTAADHQSQHDDEHDGSQIPEAGRFSWFSVGRITLTSSIFKNFCFFFEKKLSFLPERVILHGNGPKMPKDIGRIHIYKRQTPLANPAGAGTGNICDLWKYL